MWVFQFLDNNILFPGSKLLKNRGLHLSSNSQCPLDKAHRRTLAAPQNSLLGLPVELKERLIEDAPSIGTALLSAGYLSAMPAYEGAYLKKLLRCAIDAKLNQDYEKTFEFCTLMTDYIYFGKSISNFDKHRHALLIYARIFDLSHLTADTFSVEEAPSILKHSLSNTSTFPNFNDLKNALEELPKDSILFDKLDIYSDYFFAQKPKTSQEREDLAIIIALVYLNQDDFDLPRLLRHFNHLGVLEDFLEKAIERFPIHPIGRYSRNFSPSVYQDAIELLGSKNPLSQEVYLIIKFFLGSIFNTHDNLINKFLCSLVSFKCLMLELANYSFLLATCLSLTRLALPRFVHDYIKDLFEVAFINRWPRAPLEWILGIFGFYMLWAPVLFSKIKGLGDQCLSFTNSPRLLFLHERNFFPLAAITLLIWTYRKLAYDYGLGPGRLLNIIIAPLLRRYLEFMQRN